MSATQLAAFIVAAVAAVALSALACLVVWKLRPNLNHNAAPGVLALGLGLFACVVFGTGAAIANHNPNDPAANSTPHGCQAGTYDNGSGGDGPKCFPFPPGSSR